MDNIEKQIKTAIKDLEVELYDTATLKENNQNVFRVYITAVGGVTLDKCAEISRTISPLLDIYEPMGGKYNLEVSSPGIERKLKTIEHFKASVGEFVKIKNTSNEKLSGEIVKVEDSNIYISTKKSDNKQISFDTIISAKTFFKWGK